MPRHGTGGGRHSDLANLVPSHCASYPRHVVPESIARDWRTLSNFMTRGLERRRFRPPLCAGLSPIKDRKIEQFGSIPIEANICDTILAGVGE